MDLIDTQMIQELTHFFSVGIGRYDEMSHGRRQLGFLVLSSFAYPGIPVKKIALIAGSGDFPVNLIFLIKPPDFNI